MTGTPTQLDVERLERRREAIRASTERMLMECRSQRGDNAELNEGEAHRMAQARADIRGLDERIEEVRSEVQRAQIPEKYRSLGGGGRRVNSAGLLAPLNFGDEELRSAHQKLLRHESTSLETRTPGYVSPVPILPAQLWDIPTFPVHENRLMDKLAGATAEAPTVRYVQVTSVTGAAGVIAEGATKPEVLMPTTPLDCVMKKIGCHAGVSWEALSDFETFRSYVQIELMRLVIDCENKELLYGDGTAAHLNGLATASGILTLPATPPTAPNTYLDVISDGINLVRTGAALAEANLVCFHPSTWNALRKSKDQYGRYLLEAEPTQEVADSVWGVDVLVSTQVVAGDGIMLDTNKLGRVHVREPLVNRIGWSGTDFVNNIVRHLCEERLNLAVERPPAVLHITGLPTS